MRPPPSSSKLFQLYHCSSILKIDRIKSPPTKKSQHRAAGFFFSALPYLTASFTRLLTYWLSLVYAGRSIKAGVSRNYSLILSIRYQFAFVKITCSLLCDVNAPVDILFFCFFFSEFRYIFNLLYILKKVIEPLAHVFH